MDGDYDDPGPDKTLGPSESLDSDDVRNDDGDVVVDAANRWIASVEHQGLTHTSWNKAIANCDTDAFGAAEVFDQGALRQRR